MIIFTIPGQPIGKGRPRIGKVGHSYEGLVAYGGRAAMNGMALFEAACAVTLDIVCQIPASWSKRKQCEALAGRIHPTTLEGL